MLEIRLAAGHDHYAYKFANQLNALPSRLLLPQEFGSFSNLVFI